ncbi:hypothetical protein [Treponema endosymbiont of Eucomonympha sp.]|uniref:hypothetical protein n=1 Tax=Treponema endosymbiont of Eucomonympha sp. TaxID=1580831 RepID=UPI000785200B|nr:hypothetical protein [Treponema endosymbiont of Eucomonympha sp.]
MSIFANGSINKIIAADQHNEKFYDIFNNFTEVITNEQYDLVNKYWGLSCVKTKEEMSAIFGECETMYRNKKK